VKRQSWWHDADETTRAAKSGASMCDPKRSPHKNHAGSTVKRSVAETEKGKPRD